jgi:hypothetical protein
VTTSVHLKSTTGINLMHKLGVAEGVTDWLVGAGYEIVAKATGIEITEPKSGGISVVKAKFDMPLTTLHALNKDNLSEAQKQPFVSAILHEVDKLMKLPTPAKPVGALDLLPKEAKPNVHVTKKQPEPEPKAAQVVASAWPMYPKESIKSGPKIKLRDAHKMYQPVFGTSTGSRYYLVAGNEDIRIAARYVGSQLSVRIEGPNLEKYKAQIEATGINPKAGESHASIHLEVGGDDMLASKSLGAILLGLGLALETPLPDIKVIKNA